MAQRSFLPILAVTALLAAACGRPDSSPVDGDLRRDLDMAGAAAMEIAPAAARTQVVSAIEGGEAPEPPAPKATPKPKPRPSQARQSPTPRRAPTPIVQVAERLEPEPTPEPTPEPSPAPVVREPVTPAPAPGPSVEPAPAPRQIPAPRGLGGRGTWTMADVIRNAPFPILP